MSTLIENVAKVEAANTALKDAIAAKGVAVPEGTKLSGMPALIGQIETPPVPTNPRAVFAGDSAQSIIVPKMMVVDMFGMQDISYLFSDCKRLASFSLPDGFGQNATGFRYCFSGCSLLTSLSLPAGFGQRATDLYGCFSSCRSLTSLSLPAGFGQNATDIGYCFSLCSSLTSLSLPAGFGQNATSFSGCFHSCLSLVDIIGNPNFKKSLDLSYCAKLTHDSLMVVVNGLQKVPIAQKLTLGAMNLAKLTDEERKIATDKGWTLA